MRFRSWPVELVKVYELWNFCRIQKPRCSGLAPRSDSKASRPFDKERNGIVVSEGGCIYVMERLEDAKRRGSNIIAEIAGYRINSDGTDYVLPNPERQEECIRQAIENADLQPDDIDLVSTHATSTPQETNKNARQYAMFLVKVKTPK